MRTFITKYAHSTLVLANFLSLQLLFKYVDGVLDITSLQMFWSLDMCYTFYLVLIAQNPVGGRKSFENIAVQHFQLIYLSCRKSLNVAFMIKVLTFC